MKWLVQVATRLYKQPWSLAEIQTVHKILLHIFWLQHYLRNTVDSWYKELLKKCSTTTRQLEYSYSVHVLMKITQLQLQNRLNFALHWCIAWCTCAFQVSVKKFQKVTPAGCEPTTSCLLVQLKSWSTRTRTHEKYTTITIELGYKSAVNDHFITKTWSGANITRVTSPLNQMWRVLPKSDSFGQEIKTELVFDNESRDLQLYSDSFLILIGLAKAELCNF